MKDKLNRKIYPPINIRYYLQVLNENDISDEDLFFETGLNKEEIAKPDTRVSLHQDRQIIRNILKFTQKPHFALDCGMNAKITSYGILGLTVMCCKNIREATEISVAFWQTTGPMLSYSVLSDDTYFILRYENPLCLDEVLLRFRTELGFSTNKTLGDQLLQDTLPLAMVHFSYPAPSYYQYYSEIFQCPVLFDQEYSQVVMEKQVADLPLPQANPLTLKECLKSCEDAMVRMQLEDSLVTIVQQILLQSIGNFPDAQAVAELLHMSTRGLQRKLKELGTSYQQILNTVRKNIAINYLQTTDLTIDQIAGIIGYSEASNFRVAFKKWTGKSPNQYRL